MNPKTLKVLIIGIALLVFGPVLGWALSMALTIFGFFQTHQAIAQTLPSSPQNISQMLLNFSQIPTRMMLNLIPLLIGAICGSVGFFLTIYAFIKHFFGPKRNS